MFLVMLLKSFNGLLCDTGFGGVGINFKPFDCKVLSFSVRDIFDRFLMNLSLFVLVFICFAFENLLFIFAQGLRRVGAVVVSERDVWISCKCCFLFVLRKYIHESCEFIQFRLNSAQFFFFFWLLLAGRSFFLTEVSSG